MRSGGGEGEEVAAAWGWMEEGREGGDWGSRGREGGRNAGIREKVMAAWSR